jgi:hypothetical protein
MYRSSLFSIKRAALISILLSGFGFQISALAVQSATLNWNPSTNSNVAGYNIYYGTSSQTYTNVITVGNVTNATVTGLLEGVTYFFAATTYDASGNQSGFSNQASYAVPGDPTISTNSTIPTNQPALSQPVAQLPTLNAIGNLIIVKNSTAQIVNLSGITSGATNQNQKIRITVASSSRSLISSLIVNYTSPHTTGTLTLKPGRNAIGTTTVTVTVNNGSKNNDIVTQKFTVTILAKNIIKPAILNTLTNNVVVAGQSATFNVIATGTEPLTYQWNFNGAALPSQTNSTLTLQNVTPRQTGAYSTIVSNAAGSVNSASASLIVYSSAAATLTSAASANGQFTFNVSGVPGCSYVVQASTNLVDWENVQTNTAPCTFTDTNASNYSQCFYRAVMQPQ